MTSRTDELLDLARTRPLTPAERAEIDPDAASRAPVLGLVEALGGGEQRLSSAEADRLFAGATRAAPRRKRPVWLPAVGLAAAAAVAFVVLTRPSPGHDGIKGGQGRVTVALAAQRPGASSARALQRIAVLEPGEALRVVVTATAPAWLALYEVEGSGGLRLLWSSPGAVPAGQSVIGPDPGAGLSLGRGHTALWLVSADRELRSGAGTIDALRTACAGCAFERIEVEQR